MMKIFRTFFVFALLLVGSVQAAPVLVDGVAAVVDGKPIMRSDFLSQLYLFQGTPEAASMTEQQQKDFVLNQMIEEKVLLSRIDRDSIVVTDAEVNQRVDDDIARMASSQGIGIPTLEKEIRAQLGISMAQFKDFHAKQKRRHLEIQKVRQRYVGMVNPSKKDVHDFYEAKKDSILPQYNCMLLSHIQMTIHPDTTIVDSVKKEIELLIDSLNLGMSFEILAQRHSQDSSAGKGGDLGYFKRGQLGGQLDPAFERALDQLKNGQYSAVPVKTALGWHIVRVLGRSEEGVRSAQIFLKIVPSAADSVAVMQKADSLRKHLKTKEDFIAAAKQFSEDKATNFQGGVMGWFQKSEMKQAYVDPVSNLNVGEISEPVLIDDAYHLFRLDDSRQIRELNLEEDYAKIAAMAADYLERKKLDALIKKWRQEVYVDIRITE